jgi:hypothetical protein
MCILVHNGDLNTQYASNIYILHSNPILQSKLFLRTVDRIVVRVSRIYKYTSISNIKLKPCLTA